MAGLIAGLAGQAGGLQQQAIAGGFNTLNNYLSNNSQQQIQRMRNEQEQWNYKNREAAFTSQGLPSFLAYSGAGAMNNLPQVYSHLGGSNYQRTGMFGQSFRGVTGSPIQQMMGFGAQPNPRITAGAPGKTLSPQGSPPSYEEATSVPRMSSRPLSDWEVEAKNTAPPYNPFASYDQRQRSLESMAAYARGHK